MKLTPEQELKAAQNVEKIIEEIFYGDDDIIGTEMITASNTWAIKIKVKNYLDMPMITSINGVSIIYEKVS